MVDAHERIVPHSNQHVPTKGIQVSYCITVIIMICQSVVLRAKTGMEMMPYRNWVTTAKEAETSHIESKHYYLQIRDKTIHT